MRFVLPASLVMIAVFLAMPESWRAAEGDVSFRNNSSAAVEGAKLPEVILWAWERPEDLSFIPAGQVGVSYLVETLRLDGNGVRVMPNANSLRVPEGTWVMACARIEVEGGDRGQLSPQLAREVASELARLGEFPGAKAVQIDFDATASQREFYRMLLLELRRKLPQTVPLSITALTSWCEGDDWISGLPVDEAVPMLFRMGPDRTAILLQLQAGEDFREPLCRQSAGISTDEVAPRLRGRRRLYIFDASGWTRASFLRIMAKLKRLRSAAPMGGDDQEGR